MMVNKTATPAVVKKNNLYMNIFVNIMACVGKLNESFLFQALNMVVNIFDN